jgi:hypothetical protein
LIGDDKKSVVKLYIGGTSIALEKQMKDGLKMGGIPTIRKPPGSVALPNNAQWENRFEIRSETSGRIYIIAQNKTKRHFACSCPSWRTRRKCKHLTTLGLPGNEQPFEVQLS